jgi:hypothetical protein
LAKHFRRIYALGSRFPFNSIIKFNGPRIINFSQSLQNVVDAIYDPNSLEKIEEKQFFLNFKKELEKDNCDFAETYSNSQIFMDELNKQIHNWKRYEFLNKTITNTDINMNIMFNKMIDFIEKEAKRKEKEQKAKKNQQLVLTNQTSLRKSK